MKVWTSVLVLLLVLGLAGVAEAAKAGGKGAGKAGRRGVEATDPDAVNGRITAVAQIKGKPDSIVVVKSGKGRTAIKSDVAVIANSDTKITLDGQPARLEDLKAGEQATIAVTNSTATKIDATSSTNAGGRRAGKAK